MPLEPQRLNMRPVREERRENSKFFHYTKKPRKLLLLQPLLLEITPCKNSRTGSKGVYSKFGLGRDANYC